MLAGSFAISERLTICVVTMRSTKQSDTMSPAHGSHGRRTQPPPPFQYPLLVTLANHSRTHPLASAAENHPHTPFCEHMRKTLLPGVRITGDHLECSVLYVNVTRHCDSPQVEYCVRLSVLRGVLRWVSCSKRRWSSKSRHMT